MRTVRALCLALLLVLTPLSLMAPTVHASDSVIQVNTTWSGDVILSGNVTVENGTTLTLSPGTTVDGGDGYWIRVDGTLLASFSTFFSSQTPLTAGSHGAGLWTGLYIADKGHAVLNTVSIENAKTAVKVDGHLTAEKLTLTDAYIGINNQASSDIDTLTAEHVDYEVVRNSGHLNLSGGTFTDVAGGVWSTGTTTVDTITMTQVGTGLRSSSGSLSATGMGFFETTVAIASQEGASTTVNSITGEGIALFIDAANSDDLTVSNAVISGHRLLLSNGATSFTVGDVDFVGNVSEPSAVVDLRCLGDCTMNDVNISNVNNGLSLSGHGNHTLTGLELVAFDRGIEGTGLGLLSLDWTNVTAGTTGIELRDPDSVFGTVFVEMTSTASTAFDILGGSHTWGDISASKVYSSQDTSSLGLAAWYTDIAATSLTFLHYGNGIQANHATLSSDSFSIKDGNGVGIEMEQSSLVSDSLTTRVYPDAVVLESASMLHLSNWLAMTHTTPLSISSESSATVRDFQPQNTHTASSDALGDGTFIYGGSTTATISVSTTLYLEETPVTFTDLAGNPVQATIQVHGFEIVSDMNGAATLPLASSGSSADVTLAGAGVRVTLYGSQMGQSVQVPVIPQGDWTIDTGDYVFLGARPDGSPHQLTGDLTVLTGGALELADTTLELPADGMVSIEGSGSLTGSGATINANSLALGIDSVLTQSQGDSGLTIDANVTWVCQTTRNSVNVDILGTLLIQPGCDVEILDGQVLGTVTVLTGSKLTLQSSLEITVLDKGQAVSGATVSVDGALATTDSAGQVSTTSVARIVDDSSDTLAGVKSINLQIGSFYDFVTWDTISAFKHTFMASTITPGTLSSWLVLEAQWSPYFLDGNLDVEASGTLTIDDGVSLRIADGGQISVDGRIDAGAATLSSTGLGSRWGGFVIGGSSAMIDLSSTTLVEASPALYVESKGTFIGDGITMARSSGSDSLILIDPNSDGDVVLKNSNLYDAGDGCIKAFPSSTSLTLENVDLHSCNGVGVWARQVDVQLDGINIGENVSTGFDFTAVTGLLNDVNATAFNGLGNILALDSIEEEFIVSTLVGTAGSSAGITAMNCRNLQMSSIEITGSPAIDIDESAGTIDGVVLNGLGSGTAFISHHGRTSDSLLVIDLVALSYSVGIDVHADGGDASVAPLIVRNPDIFAATVVSAENYPVRIEGGTTYGIMSASGAMVIDLIDTTTENPSMYDGAELRSWKTFTLSASLNGAPHDVTFTLQTTDLTPSYSTTVQGVSQFVEMPISFAGNGTSSTLSSFTVSTQASGLPDTVIQVNITSSMSSIVEVILRTNTAPTVEITEPYSGQRVMESVHLLATASYSDDLDSLEQLTLSWVIFDSSGNEVLRGPNEAQYNITDLQHGLYVLELQVTDTLGASSTDAVDFEVTELDSDGDWTNTCTFTLSTGVWFDAENGYPCGPDSEDTDDDNDGHPDARDAWPVDPCAWQDTDGDGLPNNVVCPDGKETYLVADNDDDNNGILDANEGETSTDSGDFSTGTLLLIVLVIGGLIAFAGRMKRGGGSAGDISSVDERHL